MRCTTASVATSSTTLTAATRRRSCTTKGSAAAVATPNQTLGGSCSHETSANAATPARLPSRLITYARSGGRPDNSRPMRCATVTKSAATDVKSSGKSSVLSTRTTADAVPLEK